jgi:hypothetical protein
MGISSCPATRRDVRERATLHELLHPLLLNDRLTIYHRTVTFILTTKDRPVLRNAHNANNGVQRGKAW